MAERKDIMSKTAALLVLLFALLSGFMASSTLMSFVDKTETRMSRIEAVQSSCTYASLRN